MTVLSPPAQRDPAGARSRSWRIANEAASSRECTPSLVRIACTWVRTVVVDTPSEPLLRPLTPYRAIRALLRLRRLAPLLAEWAAEPAHAPAVSHRTVR